jgi:hypothetical protein
MFFPPQALTHAAHAVAPVWQRLLHDFPSHRLRPYGAVGIPGTVKLMQGAALGHRGEKHIGLIRLVRDVVRGVRAKDYPSEIAAIYHWTCRNYRYVRDPVHNEYVEDPVAFMERGFSSDCDDVGTFLAACCQILGNPTRFVTVGFKPTPDPDFTHIFTEAHCSRANGWVTVDPVAGPMTDAMARAATWRGHWPLDSDMGRPQILRLR